MNEVVNLGAKLASFREFWSPKLIAELNGQHVRLARLRGEFLWHAHAEEDELFLVLEGRLRIHLRDGGPGGAERTVELAPGELFVVPRGVEHKPVADSETAVLLFEPAGTVNTGDARDARTLAPGDIERI